MAELNKQEIQVLVKLVNKIQADIPSLIEAKFSEKVLD